jgi:hypothetical protein
MGEGPTCMLDCELAFAENIISGGGWGGGGDVSYYFICNKHCLCCVIMLNNFGVRLDDIMQAALQSQHATTSQSRTIQYPRLNIR